MSLTLYRLEGCPFCEVVVDELEELGVDYDSVREIGRAHV